MNFGEMAEWVETKLCSDCRQGYTCDQYECEMGRKVADILRRLAPFRGKDSDGKDVSGWLVSE